MGFGGGILARVCRCYGLGFSRSGLASGLFAVLFSRRLGSPTPGRLVFLLVNLLRGLSLVLLCRRGGDKGVYRFGLLLRRCPGVTWSVPPCWNC